jgi:hypothetical protein
MKAIKKILKSIGVILGFTIGALVFILVHTPTIIAYADNLVQKAIELF